MVKTKKLATKQKKVVVVVKPKRKTSKAVKRPRLTAPTAAKKDLEQNADAYVGSVYQPFLNRDVRIPSMDNFPTTVGSFVSRTTLTNVTATGGSIVAGAQLAPSFSSLANYTSIGLLTAYNPGVPSTTWNQYNPSIVTGGIATNFQLIRAVSMGIRILNTAALLNRGGTLYVNIGNIFPDGNWVLNVLGANETIEVDLGELPSMGDKVSWIPLSSAPLTLSTTAETGQTQNLTAWMTPNAGLTWSDNRVNLLFFLNTASSAVIQLEIVVNYEAVPYAVTEPLFDRKAVLGSQDDIALSYEKAGLQGQTDSTWAAFGESVGGVAKAGINGLMVGGPKAALAGMASQVPSMLKRFGQGALSALGGLFSAKDYENHLLACGTGLHHLSPARSKLHSGHSTISFVKLLLQELERRESEMDTTDDEESPFPIPPVPPPSPSAESDLVEIKDGDTVPPLALPGRVPVHFSSPFQDPVGHAAAALAAPRPAKRTPLQEIDLKTLARRRVA